MASFEGCKIVSLQGGVLGALTKSQSFLRVRTSKPMPFGWVSASHLSLTTYVVAIA